MLFLHAFQFTELCLSYKYECTIYMLGPTMAILCCIHTTKGPSEATMRNLWVSKRAACHVMRALAPHQSERKGRLVASGRPNAEKAMQRA